MKSRPTVFHALLAVNARDWTGLETCLAEDVVVVDHRGPRSAERCGCAAVVGFVRSLLDGIPDGRAAIQFIDARREAAMSRLHLYGAKSEVVVGLVIALRDGQITRLELFATGDDESMRARFEAKDSAARIGPVSTLFGHYLDCLNARTFEAVERYWTDNMIVVDHRPVSPLGEVRGRALVLDQSRSFTEIASDAHLVYEPLGEIGRVGMHRGAWVGHLDEGGGAFERPWRGLAVTHGDRFVRGEVFEVDDEAGALRALCRLVGGGDGGPGPTAQLWLRNADAFNRRAWDEFAACFVPDPHLADHRRTVSLSGAGAVERARGFVDLASDATLAVELLAELGGVAMVVNRFTGHLEEGGGPFEITQRCVVAARDGAVTHAELFDEDDEVGMLAAVARLRASVEET